MVLINEPNVKISCSFDEIVSAWQGLRTPRPRLRSMVARVGEDLSRRWLAGAEVGAVALQNFRLIC